ncbi:MAG: PHP domain-containing protein [Dehalococcoidia bacterium]
MHNHIFGTSTLEKDQVGKQKKTHPLPQDTAGRNGLGVADIHIHSNVSDGMAGIIEILEFVAERGDLDVIAITDHGEISGGYEARELAAKRNYPFEIIVGMEINTREGHLLALFMEKPVENNQHLTDIISAVHAQGGLCIAPHPMSPFSESINQRDFDSIMNAGEPGVYFDGIETMNATIMGSISNHRAKKINEKYKLAETGGSDAHFLISIGSGLTLFPGRTAEDFRRSILERTTIPMKGHTPSYFEIGIGQILKQQRKSRSYFFRGIIKNATRSLRK